MLEIINVQNVTRADIRAAINYMRYRRDGAYGGDKINYDLAIEALRRMEVRNEYDQ